MGFTKTLNVGIEIFLSDENYSHFTWVSDDNYYSPNYLKNLYDLNTDFSHSAWNINGKIYQTEYKSFEQLRNNFQGLASYMWSRQAISKLGLYNPNYKYASDLEYLYRTFKLIDSICYSIGYSDKSEMEYIIHSDAESVKYGDAMRQEHNEINRIYTT